jgi:hypothetical protein
MLAFFFRMMMSQLRSLDETVIEVDACNYVYGNFQNHCAYPYPKYCEWAIWECHVRPYGSNGWRFECKTNDRYGCNFEIWPDELSGSVCRGECSKQTQVPVWAIVAIGVFCCFLVVLAVYCYRCHCPRGKSRVDGATEAMGQSVAIIPGGLGQSEKNLAAAQLDEKAPALPVDAPPADTKPVLETSPIDDPEMAQRDLTREVSQGIPESRQ